MIKKNIKYIDFFTEEEKTVDHYFHLTENDILKLQVKYEGGIINTLEKTMENNDSNTMYDIINDMVLTAYGERDGESGFFYKVKDGVSLREKFEASPAYDALMIELTTDPAAGKEFIIGIMPSGVKKNLSNEEIEMLINDPSKIKELTSKDK